MRATSFYAYLLDGLLGKGGAERTLKCGLDS